LAERQRPWVHPILRCAYQSPDVKTATRLLQDLERRLESDYPGAAESVREGLEETVTVIGLGALGAPAAGARHDECGRESH
jgi:hypothetical protein